MSSRSIGIGGKLHRYLVEVGTREDEVLRRLREETEKATGGDAEMQISPEQGAFMAMLVKLMQARKALEVGTFTGYSSICVARALAPGGKVI